MTMRVLKLAGACAGVALLAGCFNYGPTNASMSPSVTLSPGVAAADQRARKSVTVASVTMQRDGFVVIHEIVDGKVVAPASIGHAPVSAGVSGNVVVELDRRVRRGEKLLAMLHNDTGEIGVYEFGPDSTAEDKPVMMDGKPVVMPLDVK